MKSKIKVFQIGYNKCGTTSLHQFFKKNGYKSVHHKKWLDDRIKANLTDDRPLLYGLEEFDLYTDSDYITREFTLLENLYPNAKFIYNFRPIKNWIESRVNSGMGKKPGLPWFKERYGILNNDMLRKFCWSEFKLHHDRVNNFFVGKKASKLLKFNLVHDDASKIIGFLPEYRFEKTTKFPKLNVGKRKHKINRSHGKP